MIEKFFKIKLETDVVLNSKLATEGNIETLDYIPGSNFLGIVASQLYNTISPEESYDIFHSGKVSYGDATISRDSELSYQVPFDYMMVKGEENLGEHEVYLQHLLDRNKKIYPTDKDDKGNEFFKQLKQKRSGYLIPSGKTITKIEKTLALKSAQDSEKRRSKDGAMYGFESLQKGQEFVFSVQFKDDKYIKMVTDALVGRKRIGKSKSAQFGQVHIEKLEEVKTIECFENSEYSLVYVQSKLCIIDKNTGQATHQPTAKDLGLDGEINWSKSYLRTHAYSPWNGKRNTNDALRTCIDAGSVLYVEGENQIGGKTVGAYKAEGLGRIIVNPEFLKGNDLDAICDFVNIELKPKKATQPKEDIDYIKIDVTTSLGNFLKQKGIEQQNEIKLSQAIQKEIDEKKELFNSFGITSSQWGAIRTYATKAKDFNQLENWLFEIKEKKVRKIEIIDGENVDVEKLLKIKLGYLIHGVAYERYWSKSSDRPLKLFRQVCEKATEHNGNATVFIAKFAAQMAKIAPNN